MTKLRFKELISYEARPDSPTLSVYVRAKVVGTIALAIDASERQVLAETLKLIKCKSYRFERAGGKAMVIELNAISPASLRAAFHFGQSRQVRIELDIVFIDGGSRPEDHLAEIARIIEGSRYQQRLDPACSDCDWHQVLNLIRRCHEQARQTSGHLITSIRIEDGASMVEEAGADLLVAEGVAALAGAM